MKLKLKYGTLLTLNYIWVKGNEIDADLCSRIEKAKNRAIANPFAFAHINVSQDDISTLKNLLELDCESHSIKEVAEYYNALADLKKAIAKTERVGLIGK